MSVTHRIPNADFAALAAGGGSTATISRLRDGQYSLVLLRICAMLQTVRDDGPEEWRRLTGALDLLCRAQERSPSAVTTVLLYPQVGAWAGHCLRRVRRNGLEAAAAELDYMAAVAAAAAIRAEVDFEIEVSTQDGSVMLPSLGSAAVGDPGRDQRVVIRGGQTMAEVATRMGTRAVPIAGSAPGPYWHELRRLQVAADGKVLDVVLDDLDPWRDCHGLGASNRLPTTDVAHWHDMLAAAWELLVRDHWVFVEGIATGLICLVPLAAGTNGHGMSATSADAFGSCALSPPTDPVSLAATLVHEFQHAKLSALHNLIALHTSTEEACYYSPWRDDPRPLWGLMHGAYAFLGVTDFWRRRRQLDSDDALADFEFARWREQTRRALGTIAASGKLTAPGGQLVTGMLAHTDDWLEPVPTHPAALASRAVTDHEISWQLRNVKPEPATVGLLAAGWLAGAQSPVLTIDATVVPSGRALQDNARLDLTQLLLRDPSRFTASCPGGPGCVSGMEGPSYCEADIAYVRGGFTWSADRYREQIMADPGGTQSWAGFILALAGSRPADQACQVLLDRPALVAAVYRDAQARGCGQRGPEDLAVWLADVTIRQVAGGSISKS
jgi:HEXXH motif-containing protein